MLEQRKLLSGANLVHKWITNRGFAPDKKNLVASLLNLPHDYFNEEGEGEGESREGGSTPDVPRTAALREFLESNPYVSEEERRWLILWEANPPPEANAAFWAGIHNMIRPLLRRSEKKKPRG